jgi:hypothetical protein
MDLVDKNPFLKMYLTSENGALKISDEGIAKLNQSQLNAQRAAYATKV